MREDDAQTVLLVRAFEEEDHEGRILSAHVRSAATRRVLGPSKPEAPDSDVREQTIGRARELGAGLVDRFSFLPGLCRVTRLKLGATPWVLAAALVLGLATNLLGPHQRINLLASPVLGVLAWNLLVYVVTIVAFALGRRSRTPSRPVSDALAGWLARGAVRRWLRGWTEDDSSGETSLLTRATTRFGRLWKQAAAPLLAARVRRILHLAAIALAVGAVAGMYVRGIAFEYRATWESTWLDAGQVQAVLGLLLGPAALLTGIAVPEVAPLGETGANAAPWIHLHAVAVLLYVVLPRALLALFETWRCRRFAASIPVDLGDGYFRKMFSGRRGASTSVEVVPYSFRPDPAVLDRLKGLLHDFFGARADIRVLPTVEYGDDPGSTDRTAVRVILFNLAQSPEAEVHGDLLERLRGGGEPLAVVDSSAYLNRVGSTGRVAERHRAWTRVAREAGVDPVLLDPASSDGEVLDAIDRALGSGR